MDASPQFDPERTIPALRPGYKFMDRYNLVEECGRGSMGVVWRAVDEQLDRLVALKFLPEVIATDPEAIRDLKRETRQCLELTHVNIVRVYDFLVSQLNAAIAMEYVDGTSLSRQKIERPGGCFTPAELKPLAMQLCDALDHAHRTAHVVHRDVKPANLLLSKRGTLKAADFGIARSLTETRTRLTSTTIGTSGTLLYMSPQQIAGERPAPSDDIYALGATLYELLTGKPPFFRGDAVSLVFQIRERRPDPLAERRAELGGEGPSIPAFWSEIIFDCLNKDPSRRPASAAEVASRLVEGRSSEVFLHTPPEPTNSPPSEPPASKVEVKAVEPLPPPPTAPAKAPTAIRSVIASTETVKRQPSLKQIFAISFVATFVAYFVIVKVGFAFGHILGGPTSVFLGLFIANTLNQLFARVFNQVRRIGVLVKVALTLFVLNILFLGLVSAAISLLLYRYFFVPSIITVVISAAIVTVLNLILGRIIRPKSQQGNVKGGKSG